MVTEHIKEKTLDDQNDLQIIESDVKDPTEIRKQVGLLKKSIKKSQDELIELQKNCRHKDGYIIKSIGDPPSVSVKRICNTCESIIGYPTDEELKKEGYM